MYKHVPSHKDTMYMYCSQYVSSDLFLQKENVHVFQFIPQNSVHVHCVCACGWVCVCVSECVSWMAERKRGEKIKYLCACYLLVLHCCEPNLFLVICDSIAVDRCVLCDCESNVTAP